MQSRIDKSEDLSLRTAGGVAGETLGSLADGSIWEKSGLITP